MARVQIDIPEELPFETVITVRVTDINYRGHVGGDGLLTMIHEARVRFLRAAGYNESDVGGASLIIADTAIVYRSEAFEGERLLFRVGAADFTRHGFDVVYRVSESVSGREVLQAKTGMVCFDYEARAVVDVPPAFKEALSALD